MFGLFQIFKVVTYLLIVLCHKHLRLDLLNRHGTRVSIKTYCYRRKSITVDIAKYCCVSVRDFEPNILIKGVHLTNKINVQ